MADVLQVIDFPFVYADFSQPETLKDALYSIKPLSDAVDLIFDKIDRKVSVERQRQPPSIRGTAQNLPVAKRLETITHINRQ